jgi:hypothetical protein
MRLVEWAGAVERKDPLEITVEVIRSSSTRSAGA